MKNMVDLFKVKFNPVPLFFVYDNRQHNLDIAYTVNISPTPILPPLERHSKTFFINTLDAQRS